MPKIMYRKEISLEAKLIVLIAKGIVDTTKAGEIKNLINVQSIDWQRFEKLLIYHELIPFAYISLKKYSFGLPDHLSKVLKQNYYYWLIRSHRLWQEFAEMADIFKRERIALLPIKGVSFLEDIYIRQPLRPMVDIDVLIKEEDLETSNRLLEQMGYSKELCGLEEKYWKQKQCHISFRKKEPKESALVEVHWALDFKRNHRKVLPHLWERTREVQIRDRKLKLLSPEDTLFSLALHNRRFGKMLCLKYVCDLGLLFNKYRDDFDWDYVLKEARQGKMRTTIFFVLSQLNLLGVSVPQAVWKDLKVSFWKRRLIHRFIEKDTFLCSPNFNFKGLYLKSHFLLYDSLWEPIKYILNIPQEQFAKFYSLKPYSKKTERLYRFRLFYIPFRRMADCFKKSKLHNL